MDSAILSLLGAFLLSMIGLFVFIWSSRKGLLVENPVAASMIFARGEIGRVAIARRGFEMCGYRSVKVGTLGQNRIGADTGGRSAHAGLYKSPGSPCLPCVAEMRHTGRMNQNQI